MMNIVCQSCTWQNAFSRHRMDNSLWFKRMELIEVKSLIWAQNGIIYEKVMWILGILRFKSIHLLFNTFIHIIHMYISNECMIDRQYSSYCFLASELSFEKKIKYSRQAAYSQSIGFAVNISIFVRFTRVLGNINFFILIVWR
jgi:hypothetical protein